MTITDEILGEMNVDGGDIEGEVEINGLLTAVILRAKLKSTVGRYISALPLTK